MSVVAAAQLINTGLGEWLKAGSGYLHCSGLIAAQAMIQCWFWQLSCICLAWWNSLLCPWHSSVGDGQKQEDLSQFQRQACGGNRFCYVGKSRLEWKVSPPSQALQDSVAVGGELLDGPSMQTHCPTWIHPCFLWICAVALSHVLCLTLSPFVPQYLKTHVNHREKWAKKAVYMWKNSVRIPPKSFQRLKEVFRNRDWES